MSRAASRAREPKGLTVAPPSLWTHVSAHQANIASAPLKSAIHAPSKSAGAALPPPPRLRSSQATMTGRARFSAERRRARSSTAIHPAITKSRRSGSEPAFAMLGAKMVCVAVAIIVGAGAGVRFYGYAMNMDEMKRSRLIYFIQGHCRIFRCSTWSGESHGPPRPGSAVRPG